MTTWKYRTRLTANFPQRTTNYASWHSPGGFLLFRFGKFKVVGWQWSSGAGISFGRCCRTDKGDRKRYPYRSFGANITLSFTSQQISIPGSCQGCLFMSSNRGIPRVAPPLGAANVSLSIVEAGYLFRPLLSFRQRRRKEIHLSAPLAPIAITTSKHPLTYANYDACIHRAVSPLGQYCPHCT
ncbi:hypothetical protein SAMN05216378_4715 [Paenibacillus catalpae]|uniref:Uncharacterized protein n=1 Tax=Paenibacillus catalpae TaxID=1045775 RepID=A0A1I2F745_9BACL|nr:hypothetical protein SAMN05216378_4715 [Paenibacillus catalpae]